MAFIRDYAAQSGDAFGMRRPWMGDPGGLRGYTGIGDPFRFRFPRLPRAVRKLTWKKVARAAGSFAGFVPGVGQAVDFARSFGLMSGDPGAPHHQAKLSHAASPPSHKARSHKQAAHAAKAAHHAHQAKHGHPHHRAHHLAHAAAHAAAAGLSFAEAHPGLAELGAKALGGIPLAGGGLEELARQASGLGGHGAMGPDEAMLPGVLPGHFGRRRRHTNPANVKALRRSIRRLEGFEKLVKSVERAFPRLKRAHAHHSHGHKPGCGCVACKRGRR